MSSLKDRETAPRIIALPLEDWQRFLLAAACYMEAHGKCERRMETRDGRVCVLGAFHHSTPYTPSAYSTAYSKLRRIAGNLSVEKWSDKHSKDHVIATMRRVACSG